MRIGILTYHWVANFGANLQALSTYNALVASGHNPIIINWVPNDAKTYYESVCTPEQIAVHNNFIASHCEMTELCITSDDVRQAVKRHSIEFVIIGSDAVFNIMHDENATADHKFPNPFWGDGLDDVPHAALSVSCQNADYLKFTDEQKQAMKRALTAFTSITVRDTWTQNMVRWITDGSICPPIHPDPVFAFNTNIGTLPSKKEIIEKFGLAERYALFSFNRSRFFPIHKKWLSNIRHKFNSTGVECVNLPRIMSSQPLELDKTIQLQLSPIDWYCLIKYSEAYVGVLMHPIIVCLHNQVPFFSFDHYGTGAIMHTDESSSKIKHILTTAGLSKYYHNLRNHIFFPPVQKVFGMIQSFPKDLCRTFAQKQSLDFCNTITRLTNTVSKRPAARHRLLFADLLSPSGHIDYNNILLRSLAAQCDIVCIAQDHVIHRFDPIEGVRTTAYQSFVPNKNDRIDGVRHRLYQLRFMRFCQKVAAKEKCDAIVFSSFDSVALALYPSMSVPVIAVSHNDIEQIEAVPSKLIFLRLCAKKANLAVLNSGASEWLKEHGVKHIIIPHGIPKTKLADKRHDTNADILTIFAPINDNADTGLVKEVLTKETDEWLANNMCQIRIRGKYIPKDISFQNIVSLPDYMSSDLYDREFSNADIILLPYSASYKYRCSAMMMEAVAKCKPIVVTDLPMAQDAICEGDEGIHIFHSANDLKQILDTIRHSPRMVNYHKLKQCQDDSLIRNLVLECLRF